MSILIFWRLLFSKIYIIVSNENSFSDNLNLQTLSTVLTRIVVINTTIKSVRYSFNYLNLNYKKVFTNLKKFEFEFKIKL